MLTLGEKITVHSNLVYPQVSRGPWDLTLATGSQYYPITTSPRALRAIWWTQVLRWYEGNRQEGQGSPKGGNRLQVSDIFLFLPQAAGGNKFFMEMFFLN